MDVRRYRIAGDKGYALICTAIEAKNSANFSRALQLAM
jgi:hypothetical protein